MCASTMGTLSRIKPRLMTWEETGSRQPSMQMCFVCFRFCGLGANEKNLAFIAIKFEDVVGHPGFDVRKL